MSNLDARAARRKLRPQLRAISAAVEGAGGHTFTHEQQEAMGHRRSHRRVDPAACSSAARARELYTDRATLFCGQFHRSGPRSTAPRTRWPAWLAVRPEQPPCCAGKVDCSSVVSRNGRAQPAIAARHSPADPCAGSGWAGRSIVRCRAAFAGSHNMKHRFAAGGRRLSLTPIHLSIHPIIHSPSLAWPKAKPPWWEGLRHYQFDAGQLPRRRTAMASVTWPVSPRNFPTGWSGVDAIW